MEYASKKLWIFISTTMFIFIAAILIIPGVLSIFYYDSSSDISKEDAIEDIVDNNLQVPLSQYYLETKGYISVSEVGEVTIHQNIIEEDGYTYVSNCGVDILDVSTLSNTFCVVDTAATISINKDVTWDNVIIIPSVIEINQWWTNSIMFMGNVNISNSIIAYSLNNQMANGSTWSIDNSTAYVNPNAPININIINSFDVYIPEGIFTGLKYTNYQKIMDVELVFQNDITKKIFINNSYYFNFIGDNL